METIKEIGMRLISFLSGLILFLITKDKRKKKMLSLSNTPANMQLTDNFQLSEFLASSAIPETKYYHPNKQELENVQKLANFLEKIRAYFHVPIYITGGARPPAVEQATGKSFYHELRKAGYLPAKNSDHATFQAADISVDDKQKLMGIWEWLKMNQKKGQSILYFKDNKPSHIHVSIAPRKYANRFFVVNDAA